MCDGSQKIYRTQDGVFYCPYPGCKYSNINTPTFQVRAHNTVWEINSNEQVHQGHVKTCRQAIAGVRVNNSHLEYPTPAPEPLSSPLLDDDAVMDEADQMFDDDPTICDITMDEDFFKDADETLVEIPDAHSKDEDIEDDTPTLDGDETGSDYDDTPGIGDDDINIDHHDDDNSSQISDGGLPKAKWSEDTVQTEAMGRVGICINTLAKVIVCLTCSSAVKPLQLEQHLNKHRLPKSTIDASCQGLITSYDLLPDPANKRPDTLITAIYGLDLVDGFWSCDRCGYACTAEKRLKTHIKESRLCKTYRQRYAQTFRPSSKRGYFGVKLHQTTDPVEDPLDPLVYLKQKFAPPPFSSIPITCPKSARDANHFLKMEHWDKYVEGRTGAEITQIMREREPELRKEVRICVERYADAAVTKLKNVDDAFRTAMGDYIGLASRGSLLQC